MQIVCSFFPIYISLFSFDLSISKNLVIGGVDFPYAAQESYISSAVISKCSL